MLLGWQWYDVAVRVGGVSGGRRKWERDNGSAGRFGVLMGLVLFGVGEGFGRGGLSGDAHQEREVGDGLVASAFGGRLPGVVEALGHSG